MADTGVKEVLDGFFAKLQTSPGTTEVNTIHAMCLMPLFEDLLGGKMKSFALKDKKFWQSLINKCFPGLRFASDTSSAMNSILYVGTADQLPAHNNIPSVSLGYDIKKAPRIISPNVTGKKFWVAIPIGYTLDRLNNLSFGGDWIEGSKLIMENITINNGQYHLYWWDSVVAARCIYQIILK